MGNVQREYRVVPIKALWIYDGKLEASPGSNVSSAAAELCAIAEATGDPISIDFNGVPLVADLASFPDDVVAVWSAEMDRRRGEYINSPECKARQVEAEKKERERKEALDDALAMSPAKMTIARLPEYDKWKASNRDGYGGAVISYAERWARLMEGAMNNGQTLNGCAEKLSHLADVEGITGFMYGAAVSFLSQTWQHGEELRQWHNSSIRRSEARAKMQTHQAACSTRRCSRSADHHLTPEPTMTTEKEARDLWRSVYESRNPTEPQSRRQARIAADGAVADFCEAFGLEAVRLSRPVEPDNPMLTGDWNRNIQQSWMRVKGTGGVACQIEEHATCWKWRVYSPTESAAIVADDSAPDRDTAERRSLEAARQYYRLPDDAPSATPPDPAMDVEEFTDASGRYLDHIIGCDACADGDECPAAKKLVGQMITARRHACAVRDEARAKGAVHSTPNAVDALNYIKGWCRSYRAQPRVPAAIAQLDDMECHVDAAIERLSRGEGMAATTPLAGDEGPVAATVHARRPVFGPPTHCESCGGSLLTDTAVADAFEETKRKLADAEAQLAVHARPDGGAGQLAARYRHAALGALDDFANKLREQSAGRHSQDGLSVQLESEASIIQLAKQRVQKAMDRELSLHGGLGDTELIGMEAVRELSLQMKLMANETQELLNELGWSEDRDSDAFNHQNGRLELFRELIPRIEALSARPTPKPADPEPLRALLDKWKRDSDICNTHTDNRSRGKVDAFEVCIDSLEQALRATAEPDGGRDGDDDEVVVPRISPEAAAAMSEASSDDAEDIGRTRAAIFQLDGVIATCDEDHAGTLREVRALLDESVRRIIGNKPHATGDEACSHQADDAEAVWQQLYDRWTVNYGPEHRVLVGSVAHSIAQFALAAGFDVRTEERPASESDPGANQ